MGEWKQVVFSLIMCSLICGIVTQIAGESKTKSLLRLICGIMFVLTLLRPIAGVNLEQLLDVSAFHQYTPEGYIAEGEKTAREELERCIKTSLETYILDKARILHADITAQVTLQENLTPDSIVIRGAVEEETQRQLQNILIMDLGIPKENQQWIGRQESNSS